MVKVDIKQYSDNACKYFCQENNKEFLNSMTDFYKAGQNNPAVAKFQLLSSIRETVDILHNMKSDTLTISKNINPLTNTFIRHGIEKAVGLIDIFSGRNHELNNLPEKIAFDKKYYNLYPKTGKIREELIKNLKKDKVTKSSWLRKIAIAKPIEEYQKLYPKTFKTRVLLLMNNRIKEDIVTPKLTNIFKKLKYLRKIQK